MNTIPLLACLLACQTSGQSDFQNELRSMADDVSPRVEQAVGLEFKYTPHVAAKTKEEVNQYLQRKMQTEFPQEELDRITLAYGLFRLIPPDLDLKKLLVDLYTEQVVGYYDPESDTLYVVEGADPIQVRLILAHELVHALQGQYVPLDSILSSRDDNDRRVAAQAVFEGQGMVSSLVAMMPDRDINSIPGFWEQARASTKQAQTSMPILASAPLILREGLTFPYLSGGEFVGWFTQQYPGEVPFGDRLPVSTEQILHPEKYRDADLPTGLEFGSDVALEYEDGLGEFETQVLLMELSGSETFAQANAVGWDGDRYGVFEADGDHGLVWWTVWDSDQDARRFASVLEREWTKNLPSDRTATVQYTAVDGVPAVVLLDTPIGWVGAPPSAKVAP